MATPLEQELRRLKVLRIRFSAEIDGKNKKLKDMEKMLEERSASLSRMTEERDHLCQALNRMAEEKDHLCQAYNEERRTMMRELETQRKDIEQQAKEIEKRDAQLDFKSKQLLVLRELNAVQGKHGGVKNMCSLDKVQVQIDTNGLHREPEEKDYELDSEINPKQTHVDKEHRSNHDQQEACQVSMEEVEKGDNEISMDLIDEWGYIKGSGGVVCNAFQDICPPIPPPESLVDPCNDMPNSSDLLGELPVPNDEIAGLEWLSTYAENLLLTGGNTLDMYFSNNNEEDDSRRFRTSNPVSVLEKSSSASGAKRMPLSPDTAVPGRVRSKRPRPAIFIQRPAPNFVSPTSCVSNVQNLSVSNSYMSSESENFSEYHPPHTPKSNGKEQKKRPGVSVKKCLHCEITKTPLWREGPMGPRTLCNACGVRYKSGRLFPEYRPAASPTYVASLHSNSHRKILEMMKVKDTSLQMS
ncbi:hypothetical protein MKW94_027098 [Papaver nudicaule]|uniref:GATA-type domain-containing protein n=1 Tax=Papaver nudicaule TaxID=74823 RepID=A0AA41VLD9_PAPNU|nr:hypothetical protein [Papaver nudicaule]